MANKLEEFSREGNFIWYYSWIYNEYELHHKSIGLLMTVEMEYLMNHMVEGETVEDALWRFMSNYMLDYFANHDGIGQRCMLKQAFSI